MKNNEATIFVFIASIIIGLLIAMNIGFEGKSNFLDVKQYNEAYNARSKLYSDLNNLKEEYYKINSKLEKYENSDEKKYKVLEEIQKEVDYNNLILGKSDVEGQGVTITLDDGIENFGEYTTMAQLVHEGDIAQVINDLKNAGAEAVSVNGRRVVYNNDVLCNGPSIQINGITIIAPFYISAIGNQDVLYDYLTIEQSYIRLLKLGAVKVNIDKEDDLKILAYTGIFNYKYISVSNELK
jgi:uncharacterized protein YlxW (UPF0749 family)